MTEVYVSVDMDNLIEILDPSTDQEPRQVDEEIVRALDEPSGAATLDELVKAAGQLLQLAGTAVAGRLPRVDLAGVLLAEQGSGHGLHSESFTTGGVGRLHPRRADSFSPNGVWPGCGRVS